MRINRIAVGNIVQSRLHTKWVGEVLEVTDDHRGALVSWGDPGGKYIRTWSYIDSLIPIKRKRKRKR
jgi:hypothetical protein